MPARRGSALHRLFLTGLLLALLSAAALADTIEGAAPGGGVAAEQSAARRPMPDWTDGAYAIPWARLVSGTAAVAALICGGVFALKKLNGGLGPGRARYLELLESRPIGRNVQLMLVRVGERVVLLACSGGAVTHLADFAGDELPDPEPAARPEEARPFGSALQRLMGVQQ